MKKAIPKVFLIFIGIMLSLYAMMMPLLSVIGERTEGMITVVRREGGERNEAVHNRYSYSVGYEFLLDDGTVISGNTKVIGNAYNAGISKGQALIRYLKVFPYLNALESDTALSAKHIILLAVGIFIIVVNSRIRSGGSRKLRKNEKQIKKTPD